MIADVFAASVATTHLAGVEKQLGAEFLNENSSPPRVVWVPSTETFHRAAVATRGVPKSQARGHFTRNATVRIRIWGKGGQDTVSSDLRATEELMEKVVRSIHEVAYGIYTLESAEWLGQDGQEVMQYGRAVDLLVSFKVPVVAEAPTTAVLTPMTSPVDMEGTADFPDSDVTGTPAP